MVCLVFCLVFCCYLGWEKIKKIEEKLKVMDVANLVLFFVEHLLYRYNDACSVGDFRREKL